MTESNVMTKEQLMVKFYQKFPEWMSSVVETKKLGPRAIAIKMDNDVSLVWLWNSDDDWQFGTKLWRMMPKKMIDARARRAENNAADNETKSDKEFMNPPEDKNTDTTSNLASNPEVSSKRDKYKSSLPKESLTYPAVSKSQASKLKEKVGK